MEQPATVMPMTKEEFWKIYYFTPFQMVTVTNPKPYDYKFMVELRNFSIRSGVKEKVPGTIANVYLSQMTRIMAQDDDKMQFLSDFALMRTYYDKLIIEVENVLKEVNNTPAYLADVPSHMRVADTNDTPPWQAPAKNAIPENDSGLKNTWGKQDEKVVVETPIAEEVSDVKEFEYEGSKFKMVIDKNDTAIFYRDGRRVSTTDFQKAASML